jgi:hypothetical protein
MNDTERPRKPVAARMPPPPGARPNKSVPPQRCYWKRACSTTLVGKRVRSVSPQRRQGKHSGSLGSLHRSSSRILVTASGTRAAFKFSAVEAVLLEHDCSRCSRDMSGPRPFLYLLLLRKPLQIPLARATTLRSAVYPSNGSRDNVLQRQEQHHAPSQSPPISIAIASVVERSADADISTCS